MFVIALAVVLGVVLLSFVLWRWRRFLFRYLQRRNINSLRALVADYLAGRIALDPAASRYNHLMERVVRYGFLASPPLPGTAAIEALTLAPPGVRENDSRIRELDERGALLRFGPERHRQMEDWLRQQRERHASDLGGSDSGGAA